MAIRRIRPFLAVAVLLTLTLGGTAQQGRPSAAQKPMLLEACNRLPLAFEQNLGQADPTVKFLARGKGYAAFLKATDALIALASPGTAPGIAEAGPCCT
jgi:hypothetical protein